ncbi:MULTISPECIES: peptidoglycan DD-metalloendopeptidase family protein [unclassified Duganella]|uniref:peptidoglycan DD-metalloendopeptidase family protein n=1 Tax=unclassified Duganella TaxID=2636909 RepID=UPI0006FC404D|nr:MULTISPECIES: peptidoglycan DD-metalloendopeptidase family protein [unclassified Duganella]KQV54529.1 peptidase M23 [Duganella sp. Root336D2]KRC03654.1 peptidase M23 [Duganella sp. Root198D2]
MTKKYSLFLMAASLVMLTACETMTQPAPVEDRSTPLAPTSPKPASEEPAKDKEGYYTVHKGDTLIRIAFDRGLNYRDLAAWNNLANPDDIKVDQVLRLTQPEGVQVAAVPTPPQIEKTPPPPRKSAPKGEKRPYSDAAVADLQKTDERPEKPAQVASAAPVPVPAVAAAVSAEDRDLSWTWPSDGRVVAQFDEGKNKGIDIAGRSGQQVLAAERGKVMYAGSGIRGYGNLVIVKHSNSLLSAYAHNRSILVKEGQEVRRGQAIAEMGDSDTDTVKLHFEIRQQGKPVDPSKFLPNR